MRLDDFDAQLYNKSVAGSTLLENDDEVPRDPDLKKYNS